jgi:hypothetical protein
VLRTALWKEGDSCCSVSLPVSREFLGGGKWSSVCAACTSEGAQGSHYFSPGPTRPHPAPPPRLWEGGPRRGGRDRSRPVSPLSRMLSDGGTPTRPPSWGAGGGHKKSWRLEARREQEREVPTFGREFAENGISIPDFHSPRVLSFPLLNPPVCAHGGTRHAVYAPLETVEVRACVCGCVPSSCTPKLLC